MTLAHDTMFGYKRFQVQKISSGWSVIEILNFHCALDIAHSNSIFSQGLCWCSINPSLVAKDLHMKRDSRNSHILIRWASRWPWPWRYQTNYLAQHSNSWWCNTTWLLPGLVTKGWAVQEISPGQKACSQTDRHTDSYTQPHTSNSVMGKWLLSDSLFPHPKLVFKLFQLNEILCVCTCMHVCVHVCLDVYMSLCMCARMYVCIM